MEEYRRALDFWNEMSKGQEGYELKKSIITSPKINEIFNKYIKDDSKILDFGCGTGWALISIGLSNKFKLGIGIDYSKESIRIASSSAKKSEVKNLEFISGDEESLDKYNNYFDFIVSVNTLDVVPDEITIKQIKQLQKSLTKNGSLLICLNPFFTEEEIINKLKMEKKGHYFYKNDILRCNYKRVEEWEELFKQYFNLIESSTFKVYEQEVYERRMYLLKAK